MADLRTPFVKMPSTDSVTLPSTPPARQKLPRFKYFASGHLQFYDPLRCVPLPVSMCVFFGVFVLFFVSVFVSVCVYVKGMCVCCPSFRVHWFDVINLRGTVLFHPGMWIQFLVLCLLATSIIVPSRTSNFDTSKWGEHITQATTLLNTLTVFLLGFFTSTVESCVVHNVTHPLLCVLSVSFMLCLCGVIQCVSASPVSHLFVCVCK